MKILTIVGARPQFIKAASLSREIGKYADMEEVIVHTGQHFDGNMSDVFFEEMQIPKPAYNLAINSLNHGAMTGRMMEAIEEVILKEKPSWVVVYGDTNSTLAGALAAKKLHVKVAHIEAGLRSYNMKMPEEINRIVTDRISDILFCPTQQAIDNLKKEGFDNINCVIKNVGDIMYDAAMFYKDRSKAVDFEVPANYILTTIHRAENTDDKTRLTNIFKALDEINKTYPVILPLHPRTQNILKNYGITTQVKLIEPVGYLEMVGLLKNASAVITDSGGLQKEAYFFEKQCFILRDETEWVELVNAGYNQLIDVLNDDIAGKIISGVKKHKEFSSSIYGDGHTSANIVDILRQYSN
jgi:UDP-GlcNAc3NAcA epimerase